MASVRQARAPASTLDAVESTGLAAASGIPVPCCRSKLACGVNDIQPDRRPFGAPAVPPGQPLGALSEFTVAARPVLIMASTFAREVRHAHPDDAHRVSPPSRHQGRARADAGP